MDSQPVKVQIENLLGEYSDNDSQSSRSKSFSSGNASSSSSSSSSSSGEGGGGAESNSGSSGGGKEDEHGDDDGVENCHRSNNYNGGESGMYEEDEKDLFGSDNEEYTKAPAISTYSIPFLPAGWSNNNHRGMRRGGRWSNERGGGGGGAGPVPRPGGPSGFGGRRYHNYQRDERFDSKSKDTLSRRYQNYSAH